LVPVKMEPKSHQGYTFSKHRGESDEGGLCRAKVDCFDRSTKKGPSLLDLWVKGEKAYSLYLAEGGGGVRGFRGLISVGTLQKKMRRIHIGTLRRHLEQNNGGKRRCRAREEGEKKERAVSLEKKILPTGTRESKSN